MLPRVIDQIKAKLAEADSAAGQAFSPAERAYADLALEQHDDSKGEETIRLGIAFNLAMMVAVLLLAQPEHMPPVIAVNVACLFADFAWLALGHRQRLIKARHIVFVFNLALVGVLSYVLGMPPVGGLTRHLVLVTGALSTLSAFLTILSPFSTRATPVLAFCYFLLPLIFHGPNEVTNIWLVIHGVGLIFSCVIRHAESVHKRREAVLDLRRREADVRAADARYQHELELAREIQDSLAPPPHTRLDDGTNVFCLMQKHERVGGDWMTVRQFPDGSLVMLLADATGKGMQAGLIIHAVQSLWATTLDDETFDAKAWLGRVNHALFRLGEKQTHSATIGIAVLKDKRCTYWSAGHLPMFALLGPERAVSFRAVVARGNVLGIAQDLDVREGHLDVAPNLPLRLLLASDGVFPRGTLTTQRDVEALHEVVVAGGAKSLELVDSGDDKTLIILSRGFPQDIKIVA